MTADPWAHVISAFGCCDPSLCSIRDYIKVFHTDAADFEAVIGGVRAARTHGPPRKLALVGHAVRGVLRIGNWNVSVAGTTDEQFGRLATSLRECGFDRVYLAGCLTARARNGSGVSNAMELQGRLGPGISVYGAIRPISPEIFRFDGTGMSPAAEAEYFQRVTADVGGSADPAKQRQAVLAWLNQHRRLSRQEARRYSAYPASVKARGRSRDERGGEWDVREIRSPDVVMYHCQETAFLAPAVLALPDLELVWKDKQGLVQHGSFRYEAQFFTMPTKDRLLRTYWAVDPGSAKQLSDTLGQVSHSILPIQ